MWTAGAQGSSALHAWDLATGAPHGKPLEHGSSIEAVAISSDGRRVLTGGADGVARIWDIDAEHLAPEVDSVMGTATFLLEEVSRATRVLTI